MRVTTPRMVNLPSRDCMPKRAFFTRYLVVAHLRLRDIAAWWDALRQPHVAANGGTGADGNAAQNRGAGVDHHVVFDQRMARHAFNQYSLLVRREALGAQRDVLVQAHALADDGGLADHHAGAMVDEEAG